MKENVKENVFVKVWKKVKKFTKDTISELKKVSWTNKKELFKSTKLVIITVVAVSVVIVLIDLGASWAVNSLAGLIG